MNPKLTLFLVPTTCAVLFTVLARGPLRWQLVVASIGGALVLTIGAWIAPTRGGRAKDSAWQTAKSIQLATAGLVAVGTMLCLTHNPGIAAMVGIGAAVAAGLVSGGRPTASRGETGTLD